MNTPDYIELHCRSAFSFLNGASFPEQLAQRGAELQLPAMALCDRDGVYGAPRFFAAAREAGVRPIIGAELTLEEGSKLPVLVQSRVGYENLCQLITRAKLRGTKTDCAVLWSELPEFAEGLVCLTGDENGPLLRALQADDEARAATVLHDLQAAFGSEGVYLEMQRHLHREEDRTLPQLAVLAQAHRLPLLATNGVLHALPAGRQVLDVFTCARHHTHLDAAGRLLSANGERYLKNAAQMHRLFLEYPEALRNTVVLGERLEFSLEKLGYQFPIYEPPNGETMEVYLRRVTLEGARRRYGRLSRAVLAQLKKELDLINRLGFAGYFLIVWDLVNFCRENDIMVQGRGSAANSAVCYSLHITAVDPVGGRLLFERFLSEGRKSWPDIDLDLPSGDRRERVIQEVYRRYGKNGAAMTANVISFRGRSAMREIGKALNFSPDVMDRFSRLFSHGDFPHTLELPAQMAQAGIPPEHPRFRTFISLYGAIYGLPRHLGQHSGGMIICQGKLDRVMPLENASMPGRVVAQWDKDDCEDLGIIKVDLLGLGMMSVLQDTIELCGRRGAPVDLATIPKDDAATYALMTAADTIGVFQIESRAQMATLPRMKPACFYDVAIEVAIIRPGPIQGGMVHPYLARRCGEEAITYFHPELEDLLKPILERTLGVPLFQEQMLSIAMKIADFSGSEAEELRRALSFHRSHERMDRVVVKLRERMTEKGHSGEVIEKIIQSIHSFALYGFPESHAISFAILAYGSAWLKVHRAAEFFACLLNNQPMGFYSSATLVKDARRHGIRTRHVCVQRSDWVCTIESDGAVRLGLCVVKGLSRHSAERLLAERRRAPFATLADLMNRTALQKNELRTLAEIGALNGLADHRRDALWKIEKPAPAAAIAENEGDLFANLPEITSPLASMDSGERLQADYAGMSLTTGPHPMALLRDSLPDVCRACDLPYLAPGSRVRIAGNVICRQRPGTAKGFVFISLEDETGIANAIVLPALFEKMRLLITEEAFLKIEGVLQNHENTIHIKARTITPLTDQHLAHAGSHDFH